MKSVYKFQLGFLLSSREAVDMPVGAKILCVQMQAEAITLWAEVDTTKPIESRTFMRVGTGWVLEDGHEYNEYIGTVQQYTMVWHIYEV